MSATTESLIERAKEAFAAYHGLGREIIDELIVELLVADKEVARLRASHDRLHDALGGLIGLLQLLENRDDVSPMLRETVRNSHRTAEALAAFAEADIWRDGRAKALHAAIAKAVGRGP